MSWPGSGAGWPLGVLAALGKADRPRSSVARADPRPKLYVATLVLHGHAPEGATAEAANGSSREGADAAVLVLARGVPSVKLASFPRGRDVPFIPGEPRQPRKHAVVVRFC